MDEAVPDLCGRDFWGGAVEAVEDMTFAVELEEEADVFFVPAKEYRLFGVHAGAFEEVVEGGYSFFVAGGKVTQAQADARLAYLATVPAKSVGTGAGAGGKGHRGQMGGF